MDMATLIFTAGKGSTWITSLGICLDHHVDRSYVAFDDLATKFQRGILLLDLTRGLISTRVLSLNYSTRIACTMLSIDNQRICLSYDQLSDGMRSYNSNNIADERVVHEEDIKMQSKIIGGEYEKADWLSEFCTKEIPTRSILLRNVGGLNHHEQFWVRQTLLPQVIHFSSRTSLNGYGRLF